MGTSALSAGERVARDGAFISRRGPGEGSLPLPSPSSNACRDDRAMHRRPFRSQLKRALAMFTAGKDSNRKTPDVNLRNPRNLRTCRGHLIRRSSHRLFQTGVKVLQLLEALKITALHALHVLLGLDGC